MIYLFDFDLSKSSKFAYVAIPNDGKATVSKSIDNKDGSLITLYSNLENFIEMIDKDKEPLIISYNVSYDLDVLKALVGIDVVNMLKELKKGIKPSEMKTIKSIKNKHAQLMFKNMFEENLNYMDYVNNSDSKDEKVETDKDLLENIGKVNTVKNNVSTKLTKIINNKESLVFDGMDIVKYKITKDSSFKTKYKKFVLENGFFNLDKKSNTAKASIKLDYLKRFYELNTGVSHLADVDVETLKNVLYNMIKGKTMIQAVATIKEIIKASDYNPNSFFKDINIREADLVKYGYVIPKKDFLDQIISGVKNSASKKTNVIVDIIQDKFALSDTLLPLFYPNLMKKIQPTDIEKFYFKMFGIDNVVTLVSNTNSSKLEITSSFKQLFFNNNYLKNEQNIKKLISRIETIDIPNPNLFLNDIEMFIKKANVYFNEKEANILNTFEQRRRVIKAKSNKYTEIDLKNTARNVRVRVMPEVSIEKIKNISETVSEYKGFLDNVSNQVIVSKLNKELKQENLDKNRKQEILSILEEIKNVETNIVSSAKKEFARLNYGDSYDKIYIQLITNDKSSLTKKDGYLDTLMGSLKISKPDQKKLYKVALYATIINKNAYNTLTESCNDLLLNYYNPSDSKNTLLNTLNEHHFNIKETTDKDNMANIASLLSNMQDMIKLKKQVSKVLLKKNFPDLYGDLLMEVRRKLKKYIFDEIEKIEEDFFKTKDDSAIDKIMQKIQKRNNLGRLFLFNEGDHGFAKKIKENYENIKKYAEYAAISQSNEVVAIISSWADQIKKETKSVTKYMATMNKNIEKAFDPYIGKTIDKSRKNIRTLTKDGSVNIFSNLTKQSESFISERAKFLSLFELRTKNLTNLSPDESEDVFMEAYQKSLPIASLEYQLSNFVDFKFVEKPYYISTVENQGKPFKYGISGYFIRYQGESSSKDGNSSGKSSNGMFLAYLPATHTKESSSIIIGYDRMHDRLQTGKAEFYLYTGFSKQEYMSMLLTVINTGSIGRMVWTYLIKKVSTPEQYAVKPKEKEYAFIDIKKARERKKTQKTKTTIPIKQYSKITKADNYLEAILQDVRINITPALTTLIDMTLIEEYYRPEKEGAFSDIGEEEFMSEDKRKEILESSDRMINTVTNDEYISALLKRYSRIIDIK